LFLETLIAVALNVREALLSSLIGVVTAAFLFNMLHIRHLLIGMLAVVFFMGTSKNICFGVTAGG